MKLLKIVEGYHNKVYFRYNKAKLYMFNYEWDKTDIKTLIEVANLLKIEGYDLKEAKETKVTRYEGLFGVNEKLEKIYLDEENKKEE